MFCNAGNPVNQAAERIIFAENGDGSITAIIEIQYDGDEERFAWVLPVPGVPQVGVSSTLAFDRLQQQTNPQYNLNTNFPDDCDFGFPTAGGADAGSVDDDGDVSVLAEGTVGPFDYQVIMVNPDLDDRAQAAVKWLTDNDYDLMDLGPDLLRDYLDDDLNLLAFRLTKGATTGAIRPIWISYESDNPFIPIRPTAVAANDDMGIMVWVVGPERAIPRNYKHLELNEALIDWNNPNATYNDVVTAAADEAMGQGFVTEYARDSSDLDQVLVQQWERDQWQELQRGEYADGAQLLVEAAQMFSGWDGMEDVVRNTVTLPDTIDIQDFLECPVCYAEEEGVVIDDQEMLKQLFTAVVKPMFDTQDLIDDGDYVTRMYTTMSADEMDVDPLFDFNPDLPDVNNIHTAEQYRTSCDGNEWYVVLPQGGVVHSDAEGNWPMGDVADQPAARVIEQLSTSGKAEIVEDRSEDIVAALAALGPQDDDGDGMLSPAERGIDSSDDCGCRAPGAVTASGLPQSLPLLAALLWLRRRRSSRRPARCHRM